MEMELNHYSHNHPLVLLSEENKQDWLQDLCSRCGEELSSTFPSYGCSKCKLFLHKSCMDLPRQLQTPLHKHSLTLSLYQAHPGYKVVRRDCDACGRYFAWDDQSCYTCNQCYFYLHIRCAFSKSFFFKKNEQEIELLWHEHHLLLTNPEPKNDGKAVVEQVSHPCLVCEFPVQSASSPAYICSQCKDVYVHKTCAELPRDMHGSLHPDHPLFLFPSRTTGQGYSCSGCHESIQYWREKLMIYCCPKCEIFFHIPCASLPPINDEGDHQHTFNLLRKPTDFICRACGQKFNGSLPWFCSACHINVDRRCSKFPWKIRVNGHKHPLELTYSIPPQMSDEHDNLLCYYCCREVDTRFAAYKCSICNFVYDLKCAEDQRNDDETTWFEDDFWPDDKPGGQFYQSFEEFLKNVPNKEDIEEERKGGEIKHFSHEHNLAFQNVDDLRCRKLCEGCMTPISSTPFYTCVHQNCDFFLHKRCATLPEKIRHRHHPKHLLTLRLSRHEDQCEVVNCQICGRYFQGFVYACNQCYYEIDVRCASIPRILKHPAHHQHPLSLARRQSGDHSCNACDATSSIYGEAFVCTQCEYALHYKSCSTLLISARHRLDEHPLTLKYGIDEDDSDSNSEEKYCEVCEDEISEKWFYYCKDCNFSAHTKCVITESFYVKLAMYEAHPHPLSFRGRESYFTSARCSTCSDNLWLKYFFECARCKFAIHAQGGCVEEKLKQGKLTLRNP